MKHAIQILLIAWLIFSGCSQQKPGDLVFSGTLEMTEHMVGARVAGRVTTLIVKEGDPVKKGQLLATLDRFEQAQKDHERSIQLHKVGGLSVQALEQATLTLQDQQILAPVDGVVLIKIKELGEVATAGAPILDIGDQSDLWIQIFVPENLLGKLKLNQPAEIRLDGIPKTFSGKISFVSIKPEFTPRNVQTAEERITQTFAVRVSLNNPPPHLRPGVSGDVILNVGSLP